LSKKFKVLLIYPTIFMQTGAPMAIASLSGSLKANDMDVITFSTHAYLMPGALDEGDARANFLFSTLPVDYSEKGVFPKETSEFDDIAELVLKHKPDLVGITATESIYSRGTKLLRHIKSIVDVPTIAGGYFPTLAPEIAIAEEGVDMICIGEGESALVELCQKLQAGKPYDDVQGLWIKNGDKIVKNTRRIENLEELPPPDFDCFDKDLMLRPVRGTLYHSVPVEFARGCPYKCTFRAAPRMETLFKEETDEKQGYFRKKSIASVMTEIRRCVDNYAPEFIYFNTETFLVMSNQEFDEFIEGYREFSLPFWIQTRPETITKERIERLQEVGLLWLSVGIEHGDAEFRSKILKRATKDDIIYDVIDNLEACGQGASINMIIGYPFESRELIYKTIDFAREVYRRNNHCTITISSFTPYRGCELYDTCVEQGLWDSSVPYIEDTEISVAQYLKSDLLSEEDMIGLHRAFPLYVYLPDEYQNKIPQAEKQTPEGDEAYIELRDILSDTLAHA